MLKVLVLELKDKTVLNFPFNRISSSFAIIHTKDLCQLFSLIFLHSTKYESNRLRGIVISTDFGSLISIFGEI